MKRLTHAIALAAPALSLALGLAFGGIATAQEGLFSPVIIVNDRAITGYELDQRRTFLELLRTPGDVDKMAREQLIDDRLRLDAGQRAGIPVNPQEVAAGMAEFAGRANLSTEEFLKAIGQAGIEPGTFEDFVEAGVVWRQVVRAKFGSRVKISEAEIDRALALYSQTGGGTRVLLAEIILPASPDQAAQSAALADELSGSIRSEGAFGSAARQYSVSPTSGAGGRLEWMPLTNLPPALRAMVLRLAPGQVSDPVPLPNAIALFQLRAIQDGTAPDPADVTVDYAEWLIPGGRSAAAMAEAARIRAKVDTCNDLYAVAKDDGLPASQLLRETRPLGQVPGDVGLELAKLDEGESSATLTRGNALVFVMLCSRTAFAPASDAAPEPTPEGEAAAEGTAEATAPSGLGTIAAAPSRDAVRVDLLNQRLGSLADNYLAELKAEAHIVEK